MSLMEYGRSRAHKYELPGLWRLVAERRGRTPPRRAWWPERMEAGVVAMRPKRQYRSLTPVARPRRFGWRGLYRFSMLCVFFAAPQSYGMWRWSVGHDSVVFFLLSTAFVALFGVFCVIARPWEERP